MQLIALQTQLWISLIFLTCILINKPLFCLFLVFLFVCFFTCTVFNCWVCNTEGWVVVLISWLPGVNAETPMTGFTSGLPPMVTTLICCGGNLASPHWAWVVTFWAWGSWLWGSAKTIGEPDLPKVVKINFCPSGLRVWLSSLRSDVCDTLFKIIWLADIVTGVWAPSFWRPLGKVGFTVV